MQYFQNTNIDFVGKRKFFTIFSTILNIIGIVLTIFLPPQLGIDFKGGAEIAFEFNKDVKISDLRSNLEKANIRGLELKSFGAANQFLVRVPEIETGPDKVTNILQQSYSDQFNIIKIDKIGPKIGSEMFIKALWAVLLAMIAMMIYIAFRFEFVYGVGAIIAIVHDVIVTFGIILIVHHLGILDLEVNQGFIAGILTVVGYSVNDTVIIFDRIRENREKHKGLHFAKMVNLSINETLSRTINTTATTIGVLVILIFFGGPVLQGFAFIMFIGIIVGTYSSVFIASNYVIWYNTERKSVIKDNPSLNTVK